MSDILKRAAVRFSNDTEALAKGYENFLSKTIGEHQESGMNEQALNFWLEYNRVIQGQKEAVFKEKYQHGIAQQYEGAAKDFQIGGNHYKNMVIQPVEFITKNNIGFIEGCIIKYVCRHQDKGGVQDIDKAIHFLELLKEMKYGE